jgi:flavin-dependent dehydrogenase
MAKDSFDTIIVGARCGGASLATHLARAGQRVLLLDAATFPSDQPLSTHFVSPVGVAWLDELGVGDGVRALAPASHGVRIDLLSSRLEIPFRGGRAGRCLRRLHLDRLLQEAAVRAGTELRDRTKVVDLLREDGRVVGVVAVHDGVRSEHRARVVVGADGRSSRVAELAGAKEYLGYDNPRFGYWAYWPVNKAWDAELRHLGAHFGFDQKRMMRLVFQTDGDLLLIGAIPLVEELPKWKGRYEEAYLETLRASPITAALIEGNAREGDLVGVLKLRYFFREAAGPGFALVGDAGLHKDPTPGYGITDALRDARNLAHAILAGSDAALVRYWRQRDVDSIDLFSFAHDMGSAGYVNPLNARLYDKAMRTPALIERLQAQSDREISPFEVVSPARAIAATFSGVMSGQAGVLPAFLAAARRGIEVQKLRKQCQEALAAAPAVKLSPRAGSLSPTGSLKDKARAKGEHPVDRSGPEAG